MTLLRGNKTLYARRDRTLDRFEWLGPKSAIGGLREVGGSLQATFARDPYVRNNFNALANVHRKQAIGADATLLVKETLASWLYSWDGTWVLDIRTQSCGMRSDTANWAMIKRLCYCMPTGKSVDRETSYSYNEDGESLISVLLESYLPPIVINEVGVRILELYDLYTEFLDMEALPWIATRRDCELIISAGDYSTGRYWVGYGADIYDLEFGRHVMTSPAVDIDACDTIVIAVDEDGYVWRSFDNGYNFYMVTTITNAVLVRVYGYGSIYVGTSAGEVYLSTDGGFTFDELESHSALTGAVVAIVRVGAGIYVLDDNGNIAVSDDNELMRCPATIVIDDPTDMVHAEGVTYIGGYASGVPTIIGSRDLVEWYTLLSVNGGSSNMGSHFDYDAQVKLASCGCGIIYATVVYSTMVGATRVAHSAIYRSVDFGVEGLWRIEWEDSVVIESSDIIFIPFDIVCCGPNYAVASGALWDRMYEYGLYYISEEYKPAVAMVE